MTETAMHAPNFNDRTLPVTMLVLHYTGMRTAGEALERLTNPASKVSAHYLVGEDGAVQALVDESRRAWHAGVSCWRGIADVNGASVGIELVNPGHAFGYRPFPKAQMKALATLCREVASRHDIPARNVVGHSDVAPLRKQDPGERFDWKWLAGQGVGLWPETGIQDSRTGVRALERLARYGYHIPPGANATVIQHIILAFQRHFRPGTLTGAWDAECDALLDSLLAMA